MAEARVEIKLLGDADTKRRLGQLEQTQKKVDQAFLTGKLSVEQYDRANRNLAARQKLVKAGLQDTAEAVRRSNAQMRQSQAASRGLVTGLRSIQAAAAAVGVTFAGWQVIQILRQAADAAAQFESSMANVATLIDTRTPQGAAQLDRLKREILGLNPALGSATDLTAGLYQALSAGAEPARAVRLVGEAALFAKAGLTQTVTAVDVLTTILNAYGSAAGSAEEISSVLFATIRAGKTTGDELARSLGRVIPSAAALNVPLTEVGAAVAALTKGGAATSEAVTSLVQVFKAFVKPTAEAEKLLRQMGLSADEMRKVVGEQGLAAALNLLKERTGGNVAEMSRFFESVEALNSVLALTGAQAQTYSGILRELQIAQKDTTIVQEAAEKQMDTLNEKLATLGRAFGNFATNLADSAGWLETEKEKADFLTSALQSLDIALNAVDQRVRGSKFLSGILAGRPELSSSFAVSNAIVGHFMAIWDAGVDALEEAKRKLAELGEETRRTVELPELERFKTAMAALEKSLGGVGKATDKTAKGSKEFARQWADMVDELEEGLKVINQTAEFIKKAETELRAFGRAAVEADPVPSALLLQRGQAVAAAVNAVRGLEQELAGERVALTGNAIDMILFEEQRRLRETEQLFAQLLATAKLTAGEREAIESQLQQARLFINQQTDIKIVQENQRALEQMSAQIDSFFQQVFLTARSFGDVWRQLLQQMLRLFTSMVAKMIAAWLSGMQTMRRGAGGILGTIFGALFPGFNLFGAAGGGGQAAAGAATGAGITPQAQALFEAQAAAGSGLTSQAEALFGAQAISGGQGVTTGGIGSAGRIATAGGLSATNISRLQGGAGLGLLSLSGITPLLATGGLALAGFGIQSGSPLLGAIGGFLGGGAVGLGLAGLLGGIFSFAGPIGAIVGLTIGLLGGIFSRGKKKRQASKIADEGFAAMTEVIEQFKKFEVDFESALASLNSIWEQMVGAWQQIGGKVGKRSIRSQRPFFEEKVRELEGIQAAREARGQLEAFGIIPEFAVGGFVNDAVRSITSSQGQILAFLHQGEAVLNARAVQSLGRSFIEQANRAPAFQQGGFTSTVPGQGNLGRQVVLNVHPGAIVINPAPGMDESQIGRAAMRELRRYARDLGV